MKKSNSFFYFCTVSLLLIFTTASGVQAITVASDSAKSKVLSAQTTATASSTIATASAAATDSAQEETVRKNIKERIGKIIEQVDENKTLQKKAAYVGTVDRVTSESITMRTYTGSTETIRIDGEATTILLLPKLSPAKLEDIEIDGQIIVMGYVGTDKTMEARRILISPTPLFPLQKLLVVGRIEKNSATKMTVIQRNNESKEILIDKKTVFKNEQGEKIKRTDLEDQQEVLVVIQRSEEASAPAKLVRITSK